MSITTRLCGDCGTVFVPYFFYFLFVVMISEIIYLLLLFPLPISFTGRFEGTFDQN